jgi:hypothetical protein
MIVMQLMTLAPNQTGHRDDPARSRRRRGFRAYRPGRDAMPTLEEITYDIGRASLAEQEAFVRDLRHRTGTLLAAQAVVASFLGGSALQRAPLSLFGWLAIVALVVMTAAAAVVLAPWRIGFTIDAHVLYRRLRPWVDAELGEGTAGWLATAGFAFQDLRGRNERAVRRLSVLSGALSILLVVETGLWILELGVR